MLKFKRKFRRLKVKPLSLWGTSFVGDLGGFLWVWSELLHEFKSSSVRIDVGTFTTLLRRWVLVMGRANGFWRKNWACTMSQPNVCPGSRQLTRSSSALTSALNWIEQKQNSCHPPPNVLPWFGTLWLLPISENETESVRTPVWYHWRDAGRIAESAWHCDGKGLPGSVPKMEKWMGPLSKNGRVTAADKPYG